MEKRYKTDYFEKINTLAKICNDNILYACKIISNDNLAFDKNTANGKNIMKEIKSNLEKDYFAPFEREDIFMLCAKLNELSENSQFLCQYASDADMFGFPSNIVALAECLKSIMFSMTNTFDRLLKYPKQGDLTPLFEKTETLLSDYKKLLYSCLKRAKNDSYNSIIHITEECARNCSEITQLIQYTLIKNS